MRSNFMTSKAEEPEKKPDLKQEDALSSASNSLAGWFLKESKAKGIPLKIPSLNIIVYPDGTVGEINVTSQSASNDLQVNAAA
jgi:hypothetical protein